MPTTRLFFTALALAGAMTAARADDFAGQFFIEQVKEAAAHMPARRAVGAPMQLSGARLLDVAQSVRSNPTGMRRDWCGAYLAVVARRAGVRAPRNPALARNWAAAGVRTTPHVGAVAVFRHHVTIIAAIVPGGFIGWGGNQHRRVQRSRFPWRGVIAIREV